MARRRFQAPELVRLLELAHQPLYVLDDTLTIVFVNEACCAWLKISADELLDRQCVYNSVAPLSNTDAVADCAITVYRGSQVIATNDDWGASTNATQLGFAFTQVGAFGLDDASKDAALILSNLTPGAYTVVLTPKAGANGRGMIEIYELP